MSVLYRQWRSPSGAWSSNADRSFPRSESFARSTTTLPDDTTSRDLALRLTAIALLLRPMGDWYVRPIVLGLAVLALVSPRILRRPETWLALAVLTACRIAADCRWPTITSISWVTGVSLPPSASGRASLRRRSRRSAVS
jgi:hypothetical protein